MIGRRHSDFHKYRLRLTFFEMVGRQPFLMKSEKPPEGNPSVWYAPTLAGYPTEKQKYCYEAILTSGIAVTGSALAEVCGSPVSSVILTRSHPAMVAGRKVK